METILVHNQCLSLGAAEYHYGFKIKEKGGITYKVATAREVKNLSIPITAKLLEYLNLCGVQPKLSFGEVFQGPVFHFGFSTRSVDVTPDSRKGYLGVYLDKFRDDVIGVEILKENCVILKLEIEPMKRYVTGMTLKPQVLSQRFLLSATDPDGIDHDNTIVFENGTSNAPFRSAWKDNLDCKITLSLSLIIHPKSGPDPGVSDHLARSRKMLEDKVLCDMTIVPGIGCPVECHRAVLATHSPVFKAMFGGDTLEAQTGRVEIPGMTEEGVRGMLEYLYGSKTRVAQESPIVCVELLEASDKYDLRELDNAMENLLVTKMAKWYTPEASLRLVLFLKDKDPSELRTNALKIFKWKFEEIKKLPAYQELFKEGPDVLMGVFDYIVSN